MFSLGRVFNKGQNESDKKEGLLKRLKNIDGKNQLDAIKHKEKSNKMHSKIKLKSN